MYFGNLYTYILYVSNLTQMFFENRKVSEPTGADMGLTE